MSDSAHAKITRLELHELDRTPAQAVRDQLYPDNVERLIELIDQGVELDPITVYSDGESYWVVDGEHRVAAFDACGKKSIPADVLGGKTFVDAQQAAADANRDHQSQPMSKQDVKAAVVAVLAVAPETSDAELHRRFGPARSTIASWRQGVESTHCTDGGSLKEHVERRKGADGKTYTIKSRARGAAQQLAEEDPFIRDIAAPYHERMEDLAAISRHATAIEELCKVVHDWAVEENSDPERHGHMKYSIGRILPDVKALLAAVRRVEVPRGNLKSNISGLVPFARCVDCESGCSNCNNTGYVTVGGARSSAKYPNVA